VFSTPPISTVGLTEEVRRPWARVDIYLTKFTPMRHNLSGRNRKSDMKLVVIRPARKSSALHMLARMRRKSCRASPIAVVMGATKQDFDRTIGIHPTAAEEFVTLRTRTRVAGVAQAAE